MKYDVIFLRSGYGKPDSRMEKEIESLVKKEYKVGVIAWDRNTSTDKKHTITIGGKNIDFYHIGIKSQLAAGFKKNLFPMIRFNKKIYSLLKKNISDYAVIHASDFDTVVPAYLISKKYKKKLIYDIYDYYVDSHNMPGIIRNIAKKIDTKIINASNAVILCNEKRLEQIEPAVPSYIEYIHNTPYEMEFSEGELENDVIKIVYVGCLVEHGRYIKELIEAVSKDNRFELHIGGYGAYEEYVKEQSEKSNNIIYYGKLSYNEVLKLESEAHIMTALYDPSLKNHQYAAPNKFYEALMAGKPLIVAKNTYIDEVVLNENIGWVLQETSNNIQNNLNLILCDIYDNRYNFGLMSKNMKRIYRDNYQWSVMEERLYKLYKNVIG